VIVRRKASRDLSTTGILVQKRPERRLLFESVTIHINIILVNKYC